MGKDNASRYLFQTGYGPYMGKCSLRVQPLPLDHLSE